MRHLVLLMYFFAALLPLAAQHDSSGSLSCPMVKIEVERLADMNLPHESAVLLNINGVPTIFGGHTTNFVPTPTVEYYKDGSWHVVETAYTHDDGFAIQLSSGKVLILGGHEKKLGIGQSYEAEFYDPVTHTCEGFASLDTKRAQASALEIDSGRVIITGNWYHEDAIEMYDGNMSFLPVKGVSVGRACPVILRTAKDDAIILGGMDSIGGRITSDVVDRLRGEPYHEPLLKEWFLPCTYYRKPACYYSIGDESKGEYTYLLHLVNAQGQTAIACVANGRFSLLPTDVPVPMSCEWGDIVYYSYILADRHAERAYLLGVSTRAATTPCDTSRLYVLIIDYASTPAHLTLGYTDVLTDFDPMQTILDADGNLMMTGGAPTTSNFKPTAATWLIHVGKRAQMGGAGNLWRRLPPWGWALIIILAIAALAMGLYHRRKNAPLNNDMPTTDLLHEEPACAPTGESLEPIDDDGDEYAELMHRICLLIEEQQLFLNSDLKVTDLANALHTSRSSISACIRSQRNCTFPQFVNTYRVAYAQQLISSQPDIKLAEIWTAAGFSSESSFYRIFKALTGTTPTAWKAK